MGATPGLLARSVDGFGFRPRDHSLMVCDGRPATRQSIRSRQYLNLVIYTYRDLVVATRPIETPLR
jgi:hypothetical protein